MLEAELGADFGSQLHQNINQRGAVRALVLGLLFGLLELVENNLLHPLQALGRRQLLLDNFPGFLEGDHAGGQSGELPDPLPDRAFRDAEVSSRVGLRMSIIEITS